MHSTCTLSVGIIDDVMDLSALCYSYIVVISSLCSSTFNSELTHYYDISLYSGDHSGGHRTSSTHLLPE